MFTEDSIEAVAKGVDLADRESVSGLLARMGRELDTVKSDKAEVEQRIEKMAVDLKEARKAEAEARALAARPADSFGSDNELRFYSQDDKLRLYTQERGVGDDASFEYGLLDDPTPRTAWHKAFQKACDAHVIATLTANPGKNYGDHDVRHFRPTLNAVHRLIDGAPSGIRRLFEAKAFDGGVGSGGEFIPAPVLPELVREIEVRSGNLAQLFEQREVSSNSQKLPVVNANPRPFLQGSFSDTFNPGAFLGDTLGTAERTIAPNRLAILTLLEDNATEDAIFDMVAEHRAQVAQSIVWGIDDCIMNGDTAGTHGDTGIASWDMDGIWSGKSGGARDHRRAWLGLRHLAIGASNSVDRSTFDEEKFKADIAAVAKPRGMSGDRVCVVSDAGMLRAISTMDGVKSAEKYGSNEVVLTGEVARAHGVRFVISDFMSEQLASTGLYTGSGATTGYVIFNRRSFRMYVRRATRVELQRDATIGGSYIVATWRGLFKQIRASGAKTVRYGFNI